MLARAAAERAADSTGYPEARADVSVTRKRDRCVLVVTPQPFYAERGTPIAVRYVLEALSQLGFETDVLTLPLGHDVEIPGMRVLRIANPLRTHSIPVGFSLRKLVFDGVMLARLVRQLRARDYVCVHAIEEGALLTLFASGRCELPLIYDMASSLPEQLAQKRIFRAAPMQALLRRIEAYMLRRASVVVCSAGLTDHVKGLAPAALVHEWRFPSGAREVAAEQVAGLRRQLDLAAEALVVLYTGNFARYQGVDLLIDAIPKVVRQIPAAVFVLVGAADQQEIEAVYAGLPENVRAQVRCLQRQPRQHIDAFLAMATVLVSPRRYGGNFPLKVFDYLAAGKPIVATDVPTHRVVLDESLALLVEPRGESWADAIVRILEDQALATALGASARDFARRELSWSRFVDLIDQIYAEALEHRTAPAATGRARHV